ncbi:MAG: hypothetical protein F6K54_26905 [Okeania sp. SIO3B5]|uniref:hypothetical protein n=1 Tax=Okeania sp. SIO3B5 TaxID=2607811 RepID=UPI0013FFCA0A|nr:hypothetical protein [Okeania sp. SIO3B5]NEO56395.1 hypothetical protein [Okeania sp. SIO3B5]
MAHRDYGTDIRNCQGVGEWLTGIMARIYGIVREWGSGSQGLWHGYTELSGVGEWLTGIMARIYGIVRSGGVAHRDYGTDIRNCQGVGEWGSSKHQNN